MPTPDGFRVTHTPPGSEPQDLTQKQTNATWTSSVPGGFGSATISIPRILTQKERGLLGPLTIEYEGRVLFDGRVEDATMRGDKGTLGTDLQAFGLQRLLTDCSIRRAWSLRSSLAPSPATSVKGSTGAGAMLLNSNFKQVVGRYDSARPNLFGFSCISPIDAAFVARDTTQIGISLPSGIAGARIMFDAICYSSSANWVLAVHSSADGVTYTEHTELVANLSATTQRPLDVALVANAIDIRISGTALGAVGGAGQGPTLIEVSNLRVLCTPLREDAAGGFYGGTILRDAVAQVPGIYPGTIEDGSDFVIAEMQRVNRSTVLDVVNQITPLYAREWAVWEGGRFDWITPNLADPGWIVPLGVLSAWRIEQSIDQLHKRTYVTFTDAADNLAKEAFADSTQARNPYVRLGAQKDGVVPAPAAMTSITAPLLAAKLNNDFGRWANIKGEATLLAGQMIKAANSARQVPAFAIRAGDNITIPELPVEDIYAAGQDGQTVFHVTSVQAGTDGNVVLTLEGLTRRADVLFARLGSIR